MKQFENIWEPEGPLPVQIPAKVRQGIIMKAVWTGGEFPKGALDYGFRPNSYWTQTGLRQMVANIKGAERKKKALELIKKGRLHEASDYILSDSLSEADRNFAGKLHPVLMGGEYLPDYKPGEVEIARITMASTTQDVISIRAFPVPKRGIGFRVVNEYNSHYTINPAVAKRPLSLLQLVRLIDTAHCDDMGPIGLGIIQINWFCNDQPAEYYAEFMAFTSEFYPGLSIHYWFATKMWLERNSKKKLAQSQEDAKI